VSLAATGSNAAGGWPYRRIVYAALAVSLVLNGFFIAGAVWTQTRPAPAAARGFEAHYQQMTAELKLDAQQRAAFDRHVAAMRTRGEGMRQQVGPLLNSAWEEAAKAPADRTQVLRLFDEAADKRRQFQHDALVQTLDFIATLSPEQRAKFVALSRERRWPRRPETR
jgi:Spy/CpxP family protein refolding chaperone